MKLTELAPRFLKFIDEKTYQYIDSIVEADGIQFLCPKCFNANGGEIGTHMILCWHPRVPLSVSPGPGRWEMLGTGYEDLTLRAGSSSIKLTGGCNAHFFIIGGAIQNLT